MSLTSVSAPILERNSADATPENRRGRARAFALDGRGMAELEDQGGKLSRRSRTARQHQPLMNVKPLILENVAIGSLRDHPSLRQVLPEVVSISEALILASQDYR